MLDVHAFVDRAPRSGEHELELVKVSGLVAAVRRVTAPPGITERALRERDQAVRDLAASVEAIVPARWGSLVADEAELAERVALLAGPLAEALALVRGREQMTLRVFGERPAPVPAPATGTAYLEARARARSAPEIDAMRPALARLVIAERVERHEKASLLATVHHLIPRGRSAEYEDIVRGAKLETTLKVSGPAPPYAFAPELGA